jgi:hypothetical protein
MLIDLSNAFNSVSRYFWFWGINTKLIRILYEQSQSCIIRNGHMSSLSGLGRGCTQDDSISPCILLFYAEILGIDLRSDTNIKGTTHWNEKYKLSPYADDTDILPDGNV